MSRPVLKIDKWHDIMPNVKGDGELGIVFRASSIGHPCPRRLWYESVQGIEPVFDQRALRIFRMGDLVENLAVEWLREDGWTVFYNAGSQEAEQEVVIPVADGVEIRGHHDAIIENGNGPIVVDIKSMNDRAFTEWRRKGTLSKYPQYLDQVHVYGKGLGISRLAICGVNKNNSEYLIESFEFDPQRWAALEAKALSVATSLEEPAVPEDLPGWCCSYCSYHGAICRG